MPTPIYVGDKLISLDTEPELNQRVLKKEKIDEEDIEGLLDQNLKDLRKILIDAIQESIPDDHLYYKQEGFLQADIDFMKEYLVKAINKIEDKDEKKLKKKYVAKELKKAAQEMYDEFNNQLVVQQLARSSQFGNKCPVYIEFTKEDSEFKDINENFARGKGSIIESITID